MGVEASRDRYYFFGFKDEGTTLLVLQFPG